MAEKEATATKDKLAAGKKAAKNPTPVTVPPPPLKVEVAFPSIFQVKQAIQMDKDGYLVLAIQFQAKVNPTELFRFINLLSQPHGAMYALIGSDQAAFDFRFDKTGHKVERIDAAKALPSPKVQDRPIESYRQGNVAVKTITGATFNHIKTELLPYGVFVNYVADGTGEIVSAAGRGKTPTEAVIAFAKQIELIPDDVTEPFEVTAALEMLESTPARDDLIRVIQVGSFDAEMEVKIKKAE